MKGKLETLALHQMPDGVSSSTQLHLDTVGSGASCQCFCFSSVCVHTCAV